MNTREEFEKWMVEEAKIIIGSSDPYPAGLECDFWRVWQACQALNDARIAELEEKLKASKEALGKIHNGVNSHFDAQMVAVEALKTIEG